MRENSLVRVGGKAEEAIDALEAIVPPPSPASSHSTKANVLVTLDTQYMDGLPVLYSNQPRQFMVSVPCKRSSSRCAGPATIVFRVRGRHGYLCVDLVAVVIL